MKWVIVLLVIVNIVFFLFQANDLDQKLSVKIKPSTAINKANQLALLSELSDEELKDRAIARPGRSKSLMVESKTASCYRIGPIPIDLKAELRQWFSTKQVLAVWHQGDQQKPKSFLLYLAAPTDENSLNAMQYKLTTIDNLSVELTQDSLLGPIFSFGTFNDVKAFIKQIASLREQGFVPKIRANTEHGPANIVDIRLEQQQWDSLKQSIPVDVSEFSRNISCKDTLISSALPY